MKEIYALGAWGKFFLTASLFFAAVLTVLPFVPSSAWAEASMSASTSAKGSSHSTVPAPSQREDLFMGTGNSSVGGFTSTFKDPQSGDIITRVIPPKEPNQPQTPLPIYIYPQVEPQWPPKNNAQPNPVFQPRTAPQSQTMPQAGSVPQAQTIPQPSAVPQPRAVPDPYSPKAPSNPSLFQPDGR